MEPTVSLAERARSEPRCSVCHDGRGALAECASCRTLFHDDCRRSLERCPTLGCTASIRVAPAPPANPRPASFARALVSAVPTLALLIVTRSLADDRNPLVIASVILHGYVLPQILFLRWEQTERWPPKGCAAIPFQLIFGLPFVGVGAVLDYVLHTGSVFTLLLFAIEPVLLPWVFTRPEGNGA